MIKIEVRTKKQNYVRYISSSSIGSAFSYCPYYSWFFADVFSLIFKSEKCLSKTGFYLMVIGALAALVAWSTGQLFTDEPSQGAIVNVFEKHENGALITMLIMIAGAALRIFLVAKKREETNLKWAVFGLYLLGFIAVTFTGYMGGTMVYNFILGI